MIFNGFSGYSQPEGYLLMGQSLEPVHDKHPAASGRKRFNPLQNGLFPLFMGNALFGIRQGRNMFVHVRGLGEYNLIFPHAAAPQNFPKKILCCAPQIACGRIQIMNLLIAHHPKKGLLGSIGSILA